MKSLIQYFMFLTVLAFSQNAFAQAWASGKAQLMKGNYKGSENLLLKAVDQSKSKADKALSLKLLGIAQFMQEKKPLAERSFRSALALNPSLSISESEVADESVIPFFNQLKSAKPAAKKPVAQQKPPSSHQSMQSIQSKKTLLKIVCNVPNAQVSLDGIAYGTAGSDMEVQPGTLVFEIFSPGYIKKAIKVQIAARTANTVKVDLQKPAPKPKPAAVSAIPLPASGVKQPGGVAAKKKNTPKKSDLFGDDSENDDFYSQAPAAGRVQNPSAQQPQYVNPPPAPQQPNLPPNAYMNPPVQQGYPLAPQPYPQQQPYYMPQQPAYPNPYQQYPVQQPYYQQPMLQPPMYQQPMPQPPSVYSPYSGYPPQGQVDPYMMAPPEPVAPAAAAPAALIPPPVTSESITGPPPMKPPKSFKKTSAKSGSSSKTSASSCSTFIKLLPFGAGQFCQGSKFKGVVLAGVQIGALYYYKLNSDSSSSHASNLTAYQSQRSTDRASIDASEEEAFDQETAQTEADGNAAISKANQNANMSLMIFGGAWVAGVADAMLFAPKTKKSAKKMRLALLPPKVFHPQTTLALINPVPLTYDENFDWYIGTGQSIAVSEEKLIHSINVGLTWEL